MFALRFWVINLTGSAIFTAGAIQGYSLVPFVFDKTLLCDLIGAVFIAGLGCVYTRRWGAVRWIGGVLVMLGLIGTVVGFVMALSGVDPQHAKDITSISPMVAALLQGMSTALYTTLLGSVGYLWLSLNAYLLAGEEI